MVAPALRRLLPQPAGPTTVREAYGVERPTPDGRPWVGLCMVTSVDGSVVLGGRAGGLGNENDVDVLLTLRELSDVIVVGAGTARAEGYGPPRSGRRIGIVTRSGALDLDSDLFRSGLAFVIAPASAPIDDSAVEVLRAGEDDVDLADAFARLHEIVPGVGFVDVEGGPALNGTLLAAGLVDEVDLTISPRVVGGTGDRMITGAPEVDQGLELAHVLVDDDGFVFTRWTRPDPS